MKIIVGLGNPGLRYAHTRHNVGFRIVEALAKKYNCKMKEKAFDGIYGTGRIEGKEVLLFKPMTYMNLSGHAVKQVCGAWMEEKDDLLVISDDFSIPLGSIRIREKGSSGGHNGLQSIIENIGIEFSRLRVGIASEEIPEDRAQYVLGVFSRKDKKFLKAGLQKAEECVETWVGEGIKKAMDRYNAG